MNTVQPAIYEMFVGELGIIAQQRISKALKDNLVPATKVSFEHITSVKSLGDELFTISVSVAPEHASQAVGILASTMASLDAGSAVASELNMAKNRYMTALDKRAARLFKENSSYVERCASAFLYNSPLSSEKEIVAFLRSRDLDINTELAHFNKVASSIQKGRCNLVKMSQLGIDVQITGTQKGNDLLFRRKRRII